MQRMSSHMNVEAGLPSWDHNYSWPNILYRMLHYTWLCFGASESKVEYWGVILPDSIKTSIDLKSWACDPRVPQNQVLLFQQVCSRSLERMQECSHYKREVKRFCRNTLICLRSRVRYPQSHCPHRHYRISLTAASPWLNRKATLKTSPPSYWFSRPETPRPQRPLNYRPFYRELHQCWKLYRDMGVRDQSQYRPWKQQLYPTRSSRPQSSSIKHYK